MKASRRFPWKATAALLAVGCLAAVCGCLSPPKYETPFAELDARIHTTQFAHLRLGLFMTENTGKFVDYLAVYRRRLRTGLNLSAGADVDPATMTAGINQILGARFQSVSTIPSTAPDQIRAYDLVMALDLRGQAGQMAGQSSEVNISGLFLAPDGTMLDTVSGQGLGVVPSPPMKCGFQKALQEALGQFARNLDSSPKMLAFAKQAGGPVVAAGPSANPTAPADTEPYRPGRCWAVVIGIDGYRDARIPALNKAEADARAMAQCLSRALQIPAEQMQTLIGAEATQQNIRSALGTWVARKAAKDDLVVLFFAGHGAPEIDLAKRSPDGLAKYLVPCDAKADDLFATGIPMAEIATIFERIEAQRIVFISDACYSGAAGGRSFMLGNFRGIRVGNPAEELAKGKGRVILTAGDASEPAAEDATLGHGVFTFYLLEGLSGKAAGDGGCVTLQGLYKYVADRVTAKSRELGGNQHPVMKGELQGDILLVPGPTAAPAVTP
jgi:hypothetical protein